MNAIVREIAVCVERGKVDAKSPHPPDLKGREGADELTVKALHFGQSPQIILTEDTKYAFER